jgi:hypothetical protein
MVQQTGNGTSHGVARGSRRLSGNEKDGSQAILCTHIRVVAGDGFEPPTFGL